MIHIKNFIDRVSFMEARSKKDLVLSNNEARMLRDDIAKLIADKLEEQLNKKEEVIQVQLSGGKW